MTSLQKKLLIGIFSTVAAAVLIAFILSETVLKKKHVAEMHRIIEDRGGQIESYEKVSLKESPFDIASSGNVIYKIIYTMNGNKYVAWYRGTKSITDIHYASRKDAPESWLFEENPND